MARMTMLSFGYWDASLASLAARRERRGRQVLLLRARRCAQRHTPLHVLLQDMRELLQRGQRAVPELVGVAALLKLNLEIVERRIRAGRAGVPPSGCHLETTQSGDAVCSGSSATGGAAGLGAGGRQSAPDPAATGPPRAARSALPQASTQVAGAAPRGGLPAAGSRTREREIWRFPEPLHFLSLGVPMLRQAGTRAVHAAVRAAAAAARPGTRRDP